MRGLLLAAIAAFGLSVAADAADNTRFPPIPPDQMDAKQKQFADDLHTSPRAGNVNNPPFKVYIRSPEFALHAIGMSDYLRWGTKFTPAQTELVILLAARQWDSGYIWHAHYRLAKNAGMDLKIPAAIAAGMRPQGMSEDQALLYDLITQSYRDHKITDATYNAAVAKFGEKGVVDAIGLASYYGITAMALIAANATYPEGDEPKLAQLAQAFPR
jgi:4-carboxymuconolactone decarboxylase